MSDITIEGNIPLHGEVTINGAKNSAIKLMFASMFSNEDIILENVPNTYAINGDIEIIKSIGGTAEWIGHNRLLLNGSKINSYEIPFEVGSRFRTTLLLAGPLLFRFGRASLPRLGLTSYRPSPINRIINVWESLGITVEVSDSFINLKADKLHPGNISFRTTSHMGTDNAIICSIFMEGDTIINNCSEEPEIEDLLGFCELLGAKITRLEPRKIKITGTKIFRGGNFTVQSDKIEPVIFASAALMTNGNIILKKIYRESMVQFVNFLTKIGANYELQGEELKIWRNGGTFNPANITVVPSPGFIPDWQPYATLLLTQANGLSTVHDTVYVDRFEYVQDLNRMGADIELVKPSSMGVIPILSDDSYDFEVQGEPLTLAKITGPSQLKGRKIQITDTRITPYFLVTAVSAEGKTEIVDYDNRFEGYEDLIGRLENLGARIYS
ncbi:UDP-N-acetylglucosamine 1-carboxyvinyltransferase [candidate division WWE3 bacterium]|uniref:UDP-N-acetylglucosamine 1-carboxyvinyltransferase n=1 Tax=candidate division WWE3 bacterium TaxID=2053526 RepID=A0A7X9DK68_UNCKA|nr:UDP-N-acetylglucosamine 1-carboxyvinyltransferase [candidate division WWE3 bacterium]